MSNRQESHNYKPQSRASRTESRPQPVPHRQPQDHNSRSETVYYDARPSSYSAPDSPLFLFPEPQIYRSLSHGATVSDQTEWRRPTMLVGSPIDDSESRTAFDSLALDRYEPPTSSRSTFHSIQSDAISAQTIDEDSIRRYQEGQSPPGGAEWHKLVPEEALTALPKNEITRQSMIFELINAEKVYVEDLELLQDIYLTPLLEAKPSIIPIDRLESFTKEVFWNLNGILGHHQRMLAELFSRQREQHPLIESITDIIMNTVLIFRDEYEEYIKHYPLAEGRHRRELLRNPRYKEFLDTCGRNPEVTKKGGFDTFLFRPVSRLPRINLLLENIFKHTEPEHPDIESMPLLLQTLSDFIKSTQPGVQAAESKAKFFALCESLQYKKGEIIDMDLHDEKRTLVHSGILARKEGSLSSWQDFDVGLLDNYLVITQKQTIGGIVKHQLISRPIPVEFLQVGAFGLPESRREEREGGGITATLFRTTRQMFPFTILHKSDPHRRYTLYAPSESSRSKWKQMIEETITIRSIYIESNRWFEPKLLSDEYFRTRTALVPSDARTPLHGRASCAVTFRSADRNFLAVAAADGVHVGFLQDPSLRLVLNVKHVTAISVLQAYSKLIVLADGVVLSYSLDIIARVAQSLSPSSALDASLERLSGNSTVNFISTGVVSERTLVAYGVRGYTKTTIHLIEATSSSRGAMLFRGQTSRVFRPFGKEFYVPALAHDAWMLHKTIAVVTDRGITMIDPTNPALVLTVPDLSMAVSDPAVGNLKPKCDASKPLGIVTVSNDQHIGVYVSRYGQPERKAAFLRWEIHAVSCAARLPHILLFGSGFVEIRHAPTGRVVQVVEGKDIRLLQTGMDDDHGSLLVAMRGRHDDRMGLSDAIFDMVKTVPLLPQTPPYPVADLPHMEMPVADTPAGASALWDEWDV